MDATKSEQYHGPELRVAADPEKHFDAPLRHFANQGGGAESGGQVVECTDKG